MLRLDIQEKLILFHEVVHFLNGDLKPGVDERQLTSHSQTKVISGNTWQMLLLSDCSLRQLQTQAAVTCEYRYLLLMCLINLYLIQHEIKGIETATYPHPLNRLGVVIAKFYGDEAEEWVGEALLNNSTQDLSIKNFPEIKIGEGEILKYIEHQLAHAFD